MNQWKFSPTKFIEESNFNPILERFYQYGISGLVRENIQNSLDHPVDSSKPVRVRIELGTLSTQNIPGYSEIRDRILSLASNNRYVKETIEDMKHHINDTEFDYISFEDSNSKGLSGSKYGQSDDNHFSYSAYAYAKGVHHEVEDPKDEQIRGGSHGVGKIASNAASIFYTMFFANHDEENHQTLGGTIQLVDHRFGNDTFRSTGYFTDEFETRFYPYENKGFHPIFDKKTRGLKIVVPFLRPQYRDEKLIVRTVCDSFMLALINNSLIVQVNDIEIKTDTLKDIIHNVDYFPIDEETSREVFTPLYYRTYNNLYRDDFMIEDKHTSYRFKLFFTYDETISIGRTGIYRSIGMKIEDKQIISYSGKPYNALLIPYSVVEDSFLKSLENESHSKLEFSHIKDPGQQKNAKYFINNIGRAIAKVIDDEISKHNTTEGIMETGDIIFEVENSFQTELKKNFAPIEIGTGENKRTLVKVADTDEEGESPRKKKKHHIGKPTQVTRVKKELGNQGTKEYYQLPGSLIKRYAINDFEILKIDLINQDLIGKKDNVTVLVTIVDGMGLEFPFEYDLKENYEFIIDNNTDKMIDFTKNSLKNISLNNHEINLRFKAKNDTSKTIKFKFYLEV